MVSRMDRHYKKDSDSKRTIKNMSLYEDMYNDINYDKSVPNVEDISVDTIDNLNGKKQIDIREVQALLEKRASFQNNRQIIKENTSIKKDDVYYEPEENKTYDINELIEKAREEQTNTYRPRSLADTQVLTLQDLISKKEYGNKSQINQTEMRDLINTIYQTNMLKKSDVGDLFEDLKATGETKDQSDIKEILKEKKAEMEKEESEGIDRSFFTSSLGFKKSDFETLDNVNDDVENSNKGTTLFLIFLTLVFVLCTAFIIIKYVI